jgi:hypothetical protein
MDSSYSGYIRGNKKVYRVIINNSVVIDGVMRRDTRGKTRHID